MARKMKDSGIEWIGEIPEGWELTKVKRIFDIGRGRVISQQELTSVGYPVYSSQTKNNGCLGYISTYDFDKSQLTWTTDGVNAGTVFLREGKYNCTNVCGTLAPKNDTNDLRYLKYALEYIAFYHKRADINGFKIMNNEMAEIELLLPPLFEQQNIANYLDFKCSQTQSILEQSLFSIEEYKKLKQAVITQAVTKGVRGKREMKDSGVEWISEIPANWTAKRGKQLFSETNERSETGSEELLTVSHITGVTPRSQKNVNMFMSESLVGYKICHNGDLAANTMWMWQGAIGVSKFHGVISPSYNTYRQKTNDYYFEYLDYLLRIRPLIDAYTIHSTGITLSRLRLYPDSFLSLYFIVPPIAEQKEIADYLDAKCTEIDRLIAKKEQLAKELESYKKSLIYEVVTGKREV